ncbi:MAG TPA: hypothetical protein VFB38_23950 [Chthonomonadaceae bacterium]|nr:hypothetical protein [Chthonomonadaceae bacterium]
MSLKHLPFSHLGRFALPMMQARALPPRTAPSALPAGATPTGGSTLPMQGARVTAVSLSPASIWLHWIFRIAVAAEFIGHGAFGVRTKAAWVPYFGVFGISPEWAYRLMPVVGSIDVSLGILTLWSPRRAALLYMAFWGLMTALLRPLSGESFWETLERAGNYGVPLAFLLLSGWGRTAREWFSEIKAPLLHLEAAGRLAILLRWTVGLLLIGHGGFGAFLHKEMLAQQYAAVRLDAWSLQPQDLVQAVGSFEILLGLQVLLAPSIPILLFAAGWKVLTELLYPLSGAPIWELVERGGSYAAPLALAILLAYQRAGESYARALVHAGRAAAEAPTQR